MAALLDADGDTLVLYGTVLPWHTDPGPHLDAPARSWAEHHRVLPEQAAEWASLQQCYPHAMLIVAGDLNMNLGGPHYYGTTRGRRMLREAMASLGLFCATETERVPAGALTWPPIDHVLLPTAWEPRAAVVAAWEGRAEDGVRLSDHSGLVVEVHAEAAPAAAGEQREG